MKFVKFDVEHYALKRKVRDNLQCFIAYCQNEAKWSGISQGTSTKGVVYFYAHPYCARHRRAKEKGISAHKDDAQARRALLQKLYEGN